MIQRAGDGRTIRSRGGGDGCHPSRGVDSGIGRHRLRHYGLAGLWILGVFKWVCEHGGEATVSRQSQATTEDMCSAYSKLKTRGRKYMLNHKAWSRVDEDLCGRRGWRFYGN